MNVTLTTDAICFRDDGALLLIRRKRPPYERDWALPGGKVKFGETVEQACLRELSEETGAIGTIQRLVGVYSKPDRDPRGWWVSTAFIVAVNPMEPVSGSDSSDARWFQNWREKRLAFDHSQIIENALKA